MSAYELLIKQCCEDSAIKNSKTSNEVRQILYEFIYPEYKGKASVEKINAVIDDITESVCLRLNIPQV
jgi:hypothetical protein